MSSCHRFKKRIETTRTGTTTRCRTQRRNQNDRSRNRRTHEVPFIAGRSHFTRKNARFRAPAPSPKQSPCNIHAAITMRFATFPSSPLPFVTTLRHHFPSSPLPKVTTLPSSPLPKSPHSLRHHLPSSSLPKVTISLGHHYPSSPPCVIAYYSFVMYCYVMSSLTMWFQVSHRPSSMSGLTILFVHNTEVLLPNFL